MLLVVMARMFAVLVRGLPEGTLGRGLFEYTRTRLFHRFDLEDLSFHNL